MSSNVRVTAKVKVQGKTNEASPEYYTLTFAPDYSDGRNAEWARFTPSLSLSMNVKNEVAQHFEIGDDFTLTFERTED